MNICFVTDNIDPQAGLGRMVGSIAAGLEKRGHTIRYVLSGSGADTRHLRVLFRFSAKNFFKHMIEFWQLRVFLRDSDVVVCFDPQPAGMIAFLASLFTKNKIVIHCLGTYALFPVKRSIKSYLMKLIYTNITRVFIINDFVRRKIEASSGDLHYTFGSNMVFVPVGVDTREFMKREMGAVSMGEYLITVGAIKPRKGQLTTVRAFSLLKDEYPKLKYVIVGSSKDSPHYVDLVKAFVNENDLNNRVVFLEKISDQELLEMYSNAKFFVMTPENVDGAIEGFGMVYIEAALCGLPAIGTLDTGAEAAVIDGETGLLVNQNDVFATADAMRTLLNDEVKRNVLAKQAEARAKTFDWSNVVDQYEIELSRLVG